MVTGLMAVIWVEIGFGRNIKLIRVRIWYATLKECREGHLAIHRGIEKYFFKPITTNSCPVSL